MVPSSRKIPPNYRNDQKGYRMTPEQLLQSIIEDVRRAYDQLPKGDSPSQDLEQALAKYDKFVSHKVAISQMDTE